MDETARSTLDRDGDLVVRPLGPGDRSAYVAALRELSSEAWRLRWGRPRRMLTDAEVDAFLAVGSGVLVALAVEDRATGRIVGVGRSTPVAGEPTAAEVAAVISDAYQRRGLGMRLLDELLRRHRERGTERVQAMTDATNLAASRLLRGRAFAVVDRDHGTLYWELPLVVPPDRSRRMCRASSRSRPMTATS